MNNNHALGGLRKIKTIIIMAITADGKIALESDQSSLNWTSKEDKQHFITESKKHKVIIVGDTTFNTFKKPLPNRLNVVYTHHPENYENIPEVLEYTNKTPKELLQDLQNRGYTSAVIGGGATINGLFLQQNYVDEIHLTIEPIVFGRGIPLFKNIDHNINLELIDHKKLNDNTLLLKYKVKS